MAGFEPATPRPDRAAHSITPAASAGVSLNRAGECYMNKVHGFSTSSPSMFRIRSSMNSRAAIAKSHQRRRFCDAKKVRPALGGEPAAREPIWGRGGVGTRSARVSGPLDLSHRGLVLWCSRVLSFWSAAGRLPALLCGCGCRRRPRVAERHPDIGVALRLALDEAVAGLEPQHDVVGLVVEDEFAAVGLHREHRVAFIPLVAYHGDQQRL